MAKEDTSNLKQSSQERERRTRLLIALLCVLLSVVAVAPFFFMGRPEPGEENDSASGFALSMPTTHDMFLHYDQMRSFYNGLKAGEIYPKWEEDTNRGFGAPTTCYYPPAIYYVTSLFYALSGEWLRALLDAQLLIMIVSAAAMYFYCHRSMSRSASFLATTAYIFMPYHLIDQYQRGAIAELLGFVWMPLMLLFGEQLMGMESALETGGARSVRRLKSRLVAIAGLGLAYGLFLWSHPPTAYQFSLSFGLYVALLAVIRKDWKGIPLVAAGIALGAALSAAYLLPAAVEQELIRHEYVSESWPYHKTYVFVHDLFNKDIHHDFFERINGIWIFGAVVIVVAGLALLVRSKNSQPLDVGLRHRVILWVTIGLVATFMMTRYSEPIGKHIPKIDIGVFTWRMLAITALVASSLAGACFEVAKRAEARPRNERMALGALGILIAVGGIAFTVSSVAWPMVRAPFFVPEEEHLNYAIIPRTAPEDPEDLPEDVPEAELDSDGGTVKVVEWKPEHRVIDVDMKVDDRLLIRTFNFPGWQAVLDGKPVEIGTGEELGDIAIDAPVGVHTVVLSFQNTRVRRIGSIITLTAGVITAGVFFIGLGLRGRHSGAG